ncbi:DNA-binding protein [Pelagibacterium sp.]|uniref:DNA-binding protein n=1 Tax=Pelagibacterium sp. TaxID=1967288 RepID=UPI003A920163
MELTKIEAAVAALEECGRDVTVRSVREALGGGSMTDVAAGLKAHREKRRMADAIQREIPPQLMDTLNEILVQVWSHVSSEHSKRLEMVQRGAASAASESDAALNELSRYVDEITLELETAKNHSHDAALELEGCRSALGENEKLLAIAENRLDDLREQLSEARQREIILIESLRGTDFSGKRATTPEHDPPKRPEIPSRPEVEHERGTGEIVASHDDHVNLPNYEPGADGPLDLQKPWTGEMRNAGASMIEEAIRRNGPVSVLELRDLATEFVGSDLIKLRDFVQQLAKQFNRFTIGEDGKIVLLSVPASKAGDDNGH